MTKDPLIEDIKKLLQKVNRREQTTLMTAFLAQEKLGVRKFIKYCAARAAEDRAIDRRWVQLGKKLDRKIRKEKKKAAEEEKLDFLADLEKFKKDCVQGKYFQNADFEEKRRAYADGDYYFEAFHESFIDDHDGIQAYLDFLRTGDKYYKQGDYGTAMKAYPLLMDLYDHDTKVERCFVDDDDLPDLDLSNVYGIEIKDIRKRYRACVSTIDGFVWTSLPESTLSNYI